MGERGNGRCAVTEEDLAQWEWLVRHVAREYTRNWGEDEWDGELFADLCQEGRVTLLAILPKHDEVKGKLRTWVGACMRHTMLKYVVRQVRQGRVPAYRVNGGTWGRPSSVLTSFDALEAGGVRGVEELGAFADDRSVRAADALLQIRLALSRADLTQGEKKVLRASLSRDAPELTHYTGELLGRARRKLRRALDDGGEPPCKCEKCARYLAGHTSGEIAAMLGVASGTVVHCVGTHGTTGWVRQHPNGRKLPVGATAPEMKQRLAAASKGHPVSGETREKLRVARLGRRHSEATRKRISLGMSRRWQERRENVPAAMAAAG